VPIQTPDDADASRSVYAKRPAGPTVATEEPLRTGPTTNDERLIVVTVAPVALLSIPGTPGRSHMSRLTEG